MEKISQGLTSGNINLSRLSEKVQLQKQSPSPQERIRALQDKDITPLLAGSLKPISSIKATEELRKTNSATGPIAVSRSA